MRFTNALYAIFYKESIKTYKVMLTLLLANFLFMAWNYISIRRLFMQDHSEVVWYRTINLGQIPYDNLAFIPLITGLIFCIYQFLQEMRDGRIRISLHAPCDSCLVVLLHALYGTVFLITLYACDALILYVSLITFYTKELSFSAMLTSLPWFIAGIYAYLGGAFVLLEPQTKRRILASIVYFGLCIPLYLFKSAGFYVNILPFFILLIPCMFYSIALSADDYRNRWVA